MTFTLLLETLQITTEVVTALHIRCCGTFTPDATAARDSGFGSGIYLGGYVGVAVHEATPTSTTIFSSCRRTITC